MSNMYANIGQDLKHDQTAINRCCERLLKIRRRMDDLRRRKSDDSLLLATWNIRDFDSNKFGFGPRLAESYYYIAELISCFDLVAVQEVNRDLTALNKVMKILGRQWDYIATDTTEGPGGNGERMAFVYNKDKVAFRRVAGEVVLPDGQLIVSPKKAKVDGATIQTEAKQQFARSPYLVTFQAGWFRFSLCTVHIYYGADSGAQLARRVAEIETLVKFFADRQDSDTKRELDARGAVENYILLGDFNVVSPDHLTMRALTSHDFHVPQAIDGAKVRKQGDHFYDQIAVRVKDERFEVMGGGMVDIFADVFCDNDEDLAVYRGHMPDKDPEAGGQAAATEAALYRKWRTWQMSDHSPLWIQIRTDFSDAYLAGKIRA